MKRIAMFIIAVLIMLTSVVQADPLPVNTPIPNHLDLAICHDGPFAEGSKTTTIYNGLPWDIVVTTSTTGIPYRWSDGPVVPQSVTIPSVIHSIPWQEFTVRASSEDVNGNKWPVGYYTGKVTFTIDGKDVPVRVRLWIAECTDGPPEYPIPEFPAIPGFPSFFTSAGIIGAILCVVMLIRIKKY